jgi:hypothetical protein
LVKRTLPFLQNEEQIHDDWSRHRLPEELMPEIERFSQVLAHHRIITQQSFEIGGECSHKTMAEEGNPASLREERQHQRGALRTLSIPN